MEEMGNNDQLQYISETEVSDIENADLSISNDHSETIYPNAKVRVEKAQFSILHLQTLCRKRNELILNPEFQRNKVWKAKQESELVESILMGIPIPLMYLFEDKNGKKQVVDGRQRITAILDFLEGKFKLNNLKILRQLNGCSFSELEPKLQGTFEDYQLFFYIIQPPTPERVKYDIFDRVNRGGTSLNKQEMRNALYRGRCTDMLQKLHISLPFLEATGRSINSERMKDQYVILRAIAFLMLMQGALDSVKDMDYRGDIDDFLARFMTYINDDASEQLIQKYETEFLQSMQNSYKILGEDGFRFAGNAIRRPINMPLFESLTYLFSLPISFINREKELIDAIDELKIEFDRSDYFSGNIDSTTSVAYRFDSIKKLANKFLS